MPRVLVLQPIRDAGIHALTDAGIEVIHAPDGERETLLRMIVGMDGLLVRTTSYRIDARVMDRAPGLKVIGRHGVGVDHIDLPAADERGIVVVNTPLANSQTVAEFTVGLMLATSRRIPEGDAAVRQGNWDARDRLVGAELAGHTLGIVGLGRIGSRVARICSFGFGMRVVYYDIVRKHEHEGALGVQFASFDDVLAQADILTLHVPHTPLTDGMIDAGALALMKPGTRLVNASRGSVVDLDALTDALGSGHLSGAAVDVFPDEPVPTDHPLLALPSALLSPHMAAASEPSLVRMSLVAEDIARVLTGEAPRYPVSACV